LAGASKEAKVVLTSVLDVALTPPPVSCPKQVGASSARVEPLSASERGGSWMSDDVHSDTLREALSVVVRVGAAPEVVRKEIAASWQRSAQTGLRPDHFEVPHDPDIN